MGYKNLSSVSTKTIAAIALVAIFILLTLHLFIHHSQNSVDISVAQQLKRSKSYRRLWQQKGIIAADDYGRLGKISIYIQQRQEMSNDDLNFWITTLKRGPLVDTPENRSMFYTDVLGLGIGRKHLTAFQQRRMYDAVLPFVSDAAYKGSSEAYAGTADTNEPSPQRLRTGTEIIAVLLLAETHDPRAMSELKNLIQNDPYPDVRKTAQECYDKLAAITH